MRGLDSFKRILSIVILATLTLFAAACQRPVAPPPETPLDLAWQARVTLNISRPAVSGGRLFVIDEQSRLAALDTTTGRKLWESPLTQVSHADDPVAVADGRVFATVQGQSGKVVALDAQSGKKLWENTFGLYRGEGQPVVQGGRVFFEATDATGTSASLRAADAATGATLWDAPAGSVIVTQPEIGDGVVYIGAYTYDAASNKGRSVSAIDMETGEVRWSYRSDLDLGHRFALDQERLYFGMDGGVVMARDAATGDPAWTARTGGRLSNAPSIAGGVVYAGTSDGALVALNARDGSTLWTLDAGSAILTEAVVYDGVVYLGTNSGYLIAVDAERGAALWKVQAPMQKRIGIPEYIPAMGTTPVIADGLLFYFNTDALNALRVE